MTLSPPLRRIAALGILGGLLLTVAPIFTGPISAYLDKQETVASETARVQQFSDRLDAFRRIERRGAILSAANRAAATAQLMARLNQVMPHPSFQPTSIQPLAARPHAPAIVELNIEAKATASGIQDLVGALEKSGSAIVIPQFSLSPAKPVASDGPDTATIFNVHMVIAGIFAAAAAK